MAEVVYAVHTRTCSYLLDEDGVCRWIISPTGMVPLDVRRCVGAQFVACLDSTVQGGLVGELVLGASGLFVKHDPATGRMILLRTTRIEHVEFRGPGASAPAGERPAPLHTPPASAPPATHRMAPPPAPRVHEPTPGVRLSKSTTFDDSFLDPDDLVQYDAETTVTLTMPLFRPQLLERKMSQGEAGDRSGSITAPAPAPPSQSSMVTLRTAPRPPPSTKRRGRRGPAADK